MAERALAAVDSIRAMVAYWDADLVCRFANNAYVSWFGKTRSEMIGLTLPELLGPLYALNRPYIERALQGIPQEFERSIPVPGTTRYRESLATYIPDVVDGTVQGFFVHVADATLLKERERALERIIRERDEALAEVRTLRGILSICASCKCIRSEDGQWVQLESYVSAHTSAQFSHGFCPSCATKLYPDLV
jgi:PAS domain S-box-containing protein